MFSASEITRLLEFHFRTLKYPLSAPSSRSLKTNSLTSALNQKIHSTNRVSSLSKKFHFISRIDVLLSSRSRHFRFIFHNNLFRYSSRVFAIAASALVNLASFVSFQSVALSSRSIVFLVPARALVQSRSSFSTNREKSARTVIQFRGRSRNRVTTARRASCTRGRNAERIRPHAHTRHAAHTRTRGGYDSLKR